MRREIRPLPDGEFCPPSLLGPCAALFHRSIIHTFLLAELGNRIELFVIQGELFSGSADPLVNPVREAPVDYILLDFRNVSGAASATI